MKVTRQPFDPGPAAWNELLPDAPVYPALEGTKTADIVIVGAGFAGLSAARQLKLLDSKLKIIVLEARRIAHGPAGRNSGFMIDLPHNLASKDYAAAHNVDVQQTLTNRAAISFAAQAASELNMTDEAFASTGKINAAATPKGGKHNRDYARHLDNMGEAYELLDAKAMQSICGSSYYTSGLFTPGTAMIQPALYVRNLAQGLTKSNVIIYENSPVIELSKSYNNWDVRSPDGKISTPKIILATNGHVESFGYFERRLMHIYLYASMTRALSKEETKALGGNSQWAFTPADPMGTTVRKITGIGGDRIIVRNCSTWAPNRTVSKNDLNSTASVHQRSFNNRFPMLKGVEMEHHWGGLLCLSRNASPAYGELENGLYSACCQNGLGAAAGTAAGIAIAHKALGKRSMIDDYLDNQPKPSKLPFEPFATIGAKAVMRWKEINAGREL